MKSLFTSRLIAMAASAFLFHDRTDWRPSHTVVGPFPILGGNTPPDQMAKKFAEARRAAKQGARGQIRGKKHFTR